jgi:tRNA (guanine9-N1)-methyltransferase
MTLVYSANKMALRPFQSLILCGQGTLAPTELLSTDLGSDHFEQNGRGPELTLFDSKVGQRMQERMLGSWERWQDVELRNEGGLEGLYNKADKPLCSIESVVYLTADTETTLETIKEGEMYVIGGLVDRNRYKNVCAEKARRLGLRTAKLPIGSDRLKSSTVMTVNQVVNILLAFNQTGSWEDALDQHLPKRKIRQENEPKADKKNTPSEQDKSDLEKDDD